ncbi:MAG: haloacid dehalogenase [Verrucomicrobia bacterium]|nr:MAG: haloacid dehalogenase [Verrucomicrobiota bacterium]
MSGTLIDWETGIRRAFRKAMTETRAEPDLEARAFKLYEMEERRIEKETPHLLYRDVLSKTALAVAGKVRWRLSPAEASFLADGLPHWTPFPDTNPALERLARRHTLGILSNVDNDLLTGTLKHFTRRFDIIVTAENVKSYKPAYGHFEEARRIIKDRPWVHVASSQYHDIEPALALGIRAVWVNRKNDVPLHKYSELGIMQIGDLRQLALHLGS